MKTDSRFLELTPTARVEVVVDDQRLRLSEGGNLAAELLAAGFSPLRHNPVSGAPRAPFCMMGACFECLVKVDGVSLRACQQSVQAGMRIESLRRHEEAEHGAR